MNKHKWALSTSRPDDTIPSCTNALFVSVSYFSSIMLNINIKAAAARAVFMISRELRNSVDQQPRFDAGHEHGY
jgi:hypothetical protein